MQVTERSQQKDGPQLPYEDNNHFSVRMFLKITQFSLWFQLSLAVQFVWHTFKAPIS